MQVGAAVTFLGIFGILLSLVAFAWFSPRKDNSRLALFLIIAILHVVSAYIYYRFVQTSDADTKLYYYDVYGFFERGFGLGTMFIVHVTQSMRNVFGDSYLDYFFVYQALGVWGLALVMRTMEETAQALNTALPPLMMGLMFLPGMYFWTAAIGKDAPLFLACALAVWSCFHISSRWYWFGLAIGIMVLIRAHVALLSVVALALALVAGRGVPTIARLILIVAAAVSGFILFGTLQSELQIDLSSVGSIANYVEQQTTAATRGVDNTLATASFPVKLVSLLYRPFFFDMTGVWSDRFAPKCRNGRHHLCFDPKFPPMDRTFRGSLAIRFATIHFLLLYLMLAFMYYNVGLGLRQREMATPALLVVIGAIVMVGQLRKRKGSTSVPAGYDTEPKQPLVGQI
ncbi:MAG: hypothetical protein IPL18_05325 [Sphingomonadales bacterium]|nr:hypothetical protein [Sphingomonadales bacterium]